MTQHLEELEDRLHELEAIMQSDRTFKEKARQALAIGEDVLDVDNAHLTRIDEDSNYWKSIVSTDPPEGEFPEGVLLDLEQTYCHRTIQVGRRALHGDAAREAGDLGAYLGVAIDQDGGKQGTICFVSESRREEPFSPCEVLFAEHLARRIEDARHREEMAETLERLDEFASTLSHDLRNPLTVAMGRLTLAADECESEHLPSVERSLQRMESMIEEVLTWVRESMEIGDLEEVALARIVRDAWVAVETKDAEYHLEDDLVFQADRQRLLRVMENLIRNAIEHGGEDVSIRIGPIEAGDGFFVEDDGPGIPPDDRERVFESGYSTSPGGTGLGLAIVESIATAHGWELAVEESRSGGARFTIREVIVDPAAVPSTT